MNVIVVELSHPDFETAIMVYKNKPTRERVLQDRIDYLRDLGWTNEEVSLEDLQNSSTLSFDSTIVREA
jgi:hypothetical protein